MAWHCNCSGRSVALFEPGGSIDFKFESNWRAFLVLLIVEELSKRELFDGVLLFVAGLIII